jgi:hypothetical protein
MRRTVLTLVAAIVSVLAIAFAAVAVTGGDSSTVTRARLERSLPQVFANVYADQAHLLGRTDVRAASLHPQAMCDKHGPDVADVGPGGDWICLMSWTDPQVPMPPEGYGKFELNVHSNDCFTAAGPTKLTGYLTITDKDGNEVTNPAFEFDGCFDPAGDNAATGNSFPSVLNVASTSLTPDALGKIGLQLTCGTGSDGCSGKITATAGKVDLGSGSFDLREESTGNLTFPAPLPRGASEVTFTVKAATGVGPSSPVTLPVQPH